MLNKVPEVTLYFWIIKILCTTVGETAADFLNDNLGLGLTNTTWVMSAVLAVALAFQFRLRQYVPGVYWLAVVLISVVGTLITDNLTDNFGVSLVTTTIVFSVVLAATFAAWYASEKTLSIHTIYTTRREAFYWLAVLFTFALGTAAGDLTAERFSVGYWQSALLFGGLIAAVYVAHVRFALNAVLAFWLAYILTRPLGASIGDYLSQPTADGGRGLGTTVTSAIFLVTISAVVVFLSITKRDRIESQLEPLQSTERDLGDRVSSSSRTRSPRLRRSSMRFVSAQSSARQSSSCSCRTPLIWRSTERPRHSRGSGLARRGVALARAGGRLRGEGPRRQQPERLRRHRRRARRATTTTRSSSRPRPATCRTGCTLISRSASLTSGTR